MGKSEAVVTINTIESLETMESIDAIESIETIDTIESIDTMESIDTIESIETTDSISNYILPAPPINAKNLYVKTIPTVLAYRTVGFAI